MLIRFSGSHTISPLLAMPNELIATGWSLCYIDESCCIITSNYFKTVDSGLCWFGNCVCVLCE